MIRTRTARTTRPGVRCAIAIVAMVAGTRVAGAQAATSSPLVMQSADGGNVLQLGVLAQLDGHFAVDDTVGGPDRFTVRRLRPILQGRLWRRLEFFFNPDFGRGTVVVQDAYVDTAVAKAVHLRAGKFKTPVGLERLAPANGLVFAERSLVSTVVPNREVGVQVLGDVHGAVSYMAALTNGSTTADADTRDSREVAVRLIARPFVHRPASPFCGLAVGIGGSTMAMAPLTVRRTATTFVPFLSYAGATADGDRVQIVPQAAYYYKSFSAFGEYVRSTQAIRRESVSSVVDERAWEVTASYMLTGEAATERAVRPRNDASFRSGKVGAVQLAVRYHALAVDRDAVALGLASPGSNRKAESFTAGVNWYLNPLVKYVANFERTVFDGNSNAPRPAEHAFVLRAQLAF